MMVGRGEWLAVVPAPAVRRNVWVYMPRYIAKARRQRRRPAGIKASPVYITVAVTVVFKLSHCETAVPHGGDALWVQAHVYKAMVGRRKRDGGRKDG